MTGSHLQPLLDDLGRSPHDVGRDRGDGGRAQVEGGRQQRRRRASAAAAAAAGGRVPKKQGRPQGLERIVDQEEGCVGGTGLPPSIAESARDFRFRILAVGGVRGRARAEKWGQQLHRSCREALWPIEATRLLCAAAAGARRIGAPNRTRVLLELGRGQSNYSVRTHAVDAVRCETLGRLGGQEKHKTGGRIVDLVETTTGRRTATPLVLRPKTPPQKKRYYVNLHIHA